MLNDVIVILLELYTANCNAFLSVLVSKLLFKVQNEIQCAAQLTSTRALKKFVWSETGESQNHY